MTTNATALKVRDAMNLRRRAANSDSADPWTPTYRPRNSAPAHTDFIHLQWADLTGSISICLRDRLRPSDTAIARERSGRRLIPASGLAHKTAERDCARQINNAANQAIRWKCRNSNGRNGTNPSEKTHFNDNNITHTYSNHTPYYIHPQPSSFQS